MKKILVLSIVAMVVTLAAFSISLYNKKKQESNLYNKIVYTNAPGKSISEKEIILAIKHDIQNFKTIDSLQSRYAENRIIYHRISPSGIMLDTVAYAQAIAEQVVIQTKSDSLLNSLERKLNLYITNAENTENKSDEITYSSITASELQTIDGIRFIFKVVLSLIFTIGSMYVVLSNKYDEGTKKWAFSVLSLISGIWIGSV